MASNIFDPTEFFTKSAHYASQGRGLFTISRLPHVFDMLPVDRQLIVGKNLLATGVLAKSVTIPAQQLATYEAHAYHGPTFKIAYGQVFDDSLTVEFLLMNDQREFAGALYHTFTKWQALIAGPEDSSGDYTVHSDSTKFGVRYYEEYCVDADVKIFSPTSDPDGSSPEIHVKYTEVYPITIGSLATSWESADAPLTLSVTFAYHYAQPQKKSGSPNLTSIPAQH